MPKKVGRALTDPDVASSLIPTVFSIFEAHFLWEVYFINHTFYHFY